MNVWHVFYFLLVCGSPIWAHYLYQLYKFWTMETPPEPYTIEYIRYMAEKEEEEDDYSVD